MRYLFVILCLGLFACSGCLKNDMGCKNRNPENEETEMMAFAATNGINATKHSSGLYYEIVNPGSGETATLNSKLFVTYTGKLMNGSTFDQATTPINFYLSGVIEGWQIGIPLIREGGKIRLIIPSTYAYGCNGSGPIPGNAVLYFDVDLIDVQ